MTEPPRLRRHPRLLEGALKPRARSMPLRAERWVWLSRLLQFSEALMPALWPALGVAALFVTLAFLDAFRFFPPVVQSVVVTAFMAVIAALAFFGLKDLRFPDRRAGLRRLERDSGLEHRPLSSFEDRPATSLNDPVSRGLWAAHRARQAQAWARLALLRRDDGLVRSDPFALRVAAVLAVVISGMAAGPEWDERLADALSPHAAAQIEGLRADLWVTPPEYTGAPPLFLTGEKAAPARDAVTVPAGSVLTARAAGVSREIRLRADPHGGGKRQTGKTVKLDDGGQESRVTLDRDATVSFRVAGRMVGRWKFAVIPDQPPTIVFARPPRTTPVGALDLALRAKDDYGVVSAQLRITLVPRPEEIAALEEAAAARRAEAEAKGTPDAAEASPELKPDFFLDPAKPVTLPLSLPGERAKEVEHKLVEALADHPWAGREVLVQLVAADDPGQKGFSKGVKLTMPERKFTQPLAQALVEQRKRLAADPYAYPQVAKVLGALLVAPEKFYEDKVVFLGLKSAHYRLTAQKMRAKDLQSVFDLLWDLAVRIEDGDLSLALERLRQAQEALKQALRDGASEAELRELMEELREAVSAYIQALIESGRTMAELPEGMAESLSGEDLAGLLDKLQQLTETGAREAAQNLLSDLAALLENLQIAKGSGGGLTQGEQAMSRALDELGEIIGDERRLLDDTFRGAQGGEENSPGAGMANEFDRFSEAPLFMPNDVQGPFNLTPRTVPDVPGENRGAERFRNTPGGGRGNAPPPGLSEFPDFPDAPLMPGLPRVPDSLSRPPAGAAPAPKVRPGRELAQDQDSVRRKLDKVMEALRKEGVDTPGTLDDAGRAMNRARESLAENDYDRALPDEREAIDKLREGAQSLARALTERLAGRQALGVGMPGGRDPLGRRPGGGNGFATDGSVKVPDESALQEARRILEELRRRAAERGRPAEELEYLDRLLKRF